MNRHLLRGALGILLCLAVLLLVPGCDTVEGELGFSDLWNWYWNRNKGLPTYSGQLILDVQDTVEIYFDDYGVPHIYAQNEYDLFFAQGYVQAMERLFQMDLFRRGTGGRLAELMGPSYLDDDRFALTIGFRRAAERSWAQTDPEIQSIVQAYTDGVNAYRARNLNNLDPAFYLLNYQPEPWTPVDSLLLGKMMGWSMSGNMGTEIFLTSAIALAGEEKAAELYPFYPDFGPILIPEDSGSASSRGNPLPGRCFFAGNDLPALGKLLELKDLGGLMAESSLGTGSNNWVISGRLTDTGSPFLANDMHLPVKDLPPIWFMNHLVLEETYNVSGASIPGAPGIVAGFNDHIAWGITAMAPDVMDLYVMELDDEANPARYLYNGEWRDVTTRQEQIAVRGRSQPETLTVVETHFGPLVSSVAGLDLPVCLRWAGLEATSEAEALARLATAANWNDFKGALQHFGTPALNFVYADAAGNIGYHAAGYIPIRSGDGLLPAPGWTGEHEWAGYIPFNELPSLYNPSSGMIVTANHGIVDQGYPYRVSYRNSEWQAPYRAMRIEEELAAQETLTLSDLEAIQGSFYNKQAEILGPVISAILSEANLTGRVPLEGRTHLLGYLQNPVDNSGSTGAAIFNHLYYRIAINTFQDEIGEMLIDRIVDYLNIINVIDHKILTGESSWFDNINTPEEETREDIIIQSFLEAVNDIGEEYWWFGTKTRWKSWGDLHKVSLCHYIGEVSASRYNRGPFNIGGSINTPAGMAYFFKGTSLTEMYEVAASAPWRFMIDIAANRGRDAMAIGNSGHYQSPHYDDQMQLWLNRQYKAMPFSEAEVRSSSRVLRLNP